MIVALVIGCEIGFWVLLCAGLALRYLWHRPRAGAVVLLCEPLLELVLLVATLTDLRNGAAPDWSHGLAAVYIGYTVGYGHYTVRWLDAHVAHRFAGGPRPPKRYGTARAVHEWKMCARTLLSSAVAAALLQGAIVYVGDAERTAPLHEWQGTLAFVTAVNVVIALSYTIWPKRPPAASRG